MGYNGAKGGVDMTEEIYGDVLFIINFSMDFLSLYMAARLMHLPIRPWRVIMGATVGALYGVLELLLSVGKLLAFFLTVMVMLLMCILAFGKQRGGRLLMSTVLFCGVNMLMGGMMTAIFMNLGAYRQYIVIDSRLHTIFGDMPIWLFAILSALSALFAWSMGRIFRAKRAMRTCRLRVTFGGKTEELMGLLDSGNLAEEPISGTPVIFLKEKDAVFLPKELLALMRMGALAMAENTAYRLRFVPTRTATGEGILAAVIPERVELFTEGRFEVRHALLAVDFSEGDYGGLCALVPEVLMN